ncbi:pectinesterase inhibitor 4-like [Lotus japonicus]|uniref:pectinesterase inhibitor 4-like n=1 Tax=Lotus japonicus TaxID=34305 RepID=UPI0025851F8D|nr:pectinesterase inhibitor 4-like [Lotus japonicus]
MEANTFPRPVSSHQVLAIIIFTFLAISSLSSACNNNSTTPTNSTQTYDYKNTTFPSNSTNTFRAYIKTSCISTTYPSICYSTLYPYASKIEADPLKLCNISLSLALKASKSASSTISETLESNNLTGTAEEVVQDCLSNVKDSIGQLKDSLNVMEGLELDGVDKKFQISNIKTWVSAAITNDQTCYDGFDAMSVDTAVRDKIRSTVLNVARKTSNALYFINNNIY